MEDIESYVRKKLKEYNEKDIVFLKKRWRELINKGDLDFFKKEKGLNIQTVYTLFNPEKIKSIRLTKSIGRYEVCLQHNNQYDVSIFIKFDEPEKGNLGILTLYKHKKRT